MRISRVRWVSLILFASMLLTSTLAISSRAQSVVTVSVQASTAESNFPQGMDFALKASVSEAVTQVDLVYVEARLQTMELLPAEFEQVGNELTASASADMATYFVPAGIDLTFHWVVTFADEAVAETETAVVTWLDNRFDWARTDGAGFEVYSYGQSDEFVSFVVATASESVASLTALYAPPEVLPIRIWLYESGEDFAGTQAANSQEWAAGAAYPSLQVILAVIPEDSESEVLRVIPHEISHQILHQATLNPFNSPATWIDEGLAVTAQTGGKDHYRRMVENAYEDDELLSLRGLISSFPFDPADASLAYGESFLVTEFILSQYGDVAIQKIIAAYRAGTSHDQVTETALGMSIEELEAEWLSHLGDSAQYWSAA